MTTRSQPVSNRTDQGRFAPGSSGNPGGRPRLPDGFKGRGEEALQRIVAMMNSGDEALALRAATWVAERIYGKPAQPMEHDTQPVKSALTQEQIDAIYRAQGARKS